MKKTLFLLIAASLATTAWANEIRTLLDCGDDSTGIQIDESITSTSRILSASYKGGDTIDNVTPFGSKTSEVRGYLAYDRVSIKVFINKDQNSDLQYPKVRATIIIKGKPATTVICDDESDWEEAL